MKKNDLLNVKSIITISDWFDEFITNVAGIILQDEEHI